MPSRTCACVVAPKMALVCVGRGRNDSSGEENSVRKRAKAKAKRQRRKRQRRKRQRRKRQRRKRQRRKRQRRKRQRQRAKAKRRRAAALQKKKEGKWLRGWQLWWIGGVSGMSLRGRRI